MLYTTVENWPLCAWKDLMLGGSWGGKRFECNLGGFICCFLSFSRRPAEILGMSGTRFQVRDADQNRIISASYVEY